MGFLEPSLTPLEPLPAPLLAPTAWLPRGVVEWSASLGRYEPVAGADPPAPYDLQLLGNPVDADAELRVDWDSGGVPTDLVTLEGGTYELPSAASAVVLASDDREIASATFLADWEMVVEDRCGVTGMSLTARSIGLDVTLGSHGLGLVLETTGSSTDLAIDGTIGTIEASVGVTLDEQVRILSAPCSELPLGGMIGTPTDIGVDASIASSRHTASATFDADAITWAGPDLTALDMLGRLTIDGSPVVSMDGRYDASADPPFDGSVYFDDRTMTFEEIIDALFPPETP